MFEVHDNETRDELRELAEILRITQADLDVMVRKLEAAPGDRLPAPRMRRARRKR